jgi:hypothetical protein
MAVMCVVVGPIESAVGQRDRIGLTSEDGAGHEERDDFRARVAIETPETLRLRHRQSQAGHFQELAGDTESELFNVVLHKKIVRAMRNGNRR